MIISLIGYSGIGKSLLARKLEQELGWLRLACDERIEKRLRSELTGIDGAGEERLASWMGPPWEERSAERQQLYLLLEEQVLDEICDQLEEALGNPGSPDIVVDTTGSSIYLDDDVLQRLRKFSQIVFLEATPAEHAALLERFYSSPKPIIWDGHFAKQDGETPDDAIRRCYPKLIAAREGRYKALADARICLEPEKRLALSATEFLELIQGALTAKSGS